MLKNKLDFKLINITLLVLIIFLLYQTSDLWIGLVMLLSKIIFPFLIAFAVAYALFICDKKCGKLCLIWAILVALSRIYMCVHYPTDVFAGIMLGFIIAHVASLIVNYIQKYYCMKYMGYIKVNSMLKRRNA